MTLTAPAGADPAVIIATNTLAVMRLGGVAPDPPTRAEFETLCRWIVDHQHCGKPYGEPPIGMSINQWRRLFDLPPFEIPEADQMHVPIPEVAPYVTFDEPKPRRRFRLLRRKAAA